MALSEERVPRAHTSLRNAIETRWQGGDYFPCWRARIEHPCQQPHGLYADRLALGQQFHDMRARPEPDTGHANPYVHVPRARVRRRHNRDSVNPVHLHPERTWASVVADQHLAAVHAAERNTHCIGGPFASLRIHCGPLAAGAGLQIDSRNGLIVVSRLGRQVMVTDAFPTFVEVADFDAAGQGMVSKRRLRHGSSPMSWPSASSILIAHDPLRR